MNHCCPDHSACSHPVPSLHPSVSLETLTSQKTSFTEKYTTTCPISISTEVYMYVNTESSSFAQLPVCDLVRTNLTSYSTSRCLSSLLLFGSGSGSVDLKNRCQSWASSVGRATEAAAFLHWTFSISPCSLPHCQMQRWKKERWFNLQSVFNL